MSEPGTDADDPLAAVGVLAEPLRRRLYRHIVDHGGDVTRAAAADAVGAQRTLVAFHLDKLVEAGLLEVSRGKVSGRDGPGSGRPAKLYRRAGREHSVQLPPRDYATAARVLAEAVLREGAEDALHTAAREEGVRQGKALAPDERPDAAGGLARCLERNGYEPAPDPADPAVLRLRNCPFHALARDYPPLACGMNLELLRGVLEGAGAAGFSARMDPVKGGCCVAISKNNES
ncbi:helix-turn-helix transcriptional regulator [Nocardiopsis sediminis]|uniref:Helix-turn-helix transcriptional regulator n=1 Tax=Nocardiopsis sediminis TaxID=1778267 RepID=A0ABV8FUH8_9ACTN